MPERQLSEHERAALRRPDLGGPQTDIGLAPHPLVALGQQVGNAHVARMLAQREAVPEEEEELQMSRDPALQREAVPEEEEELQMSRDPALQREAVPEEEDELMLSREGPEVGPEGGPVSDATAGRINAMRGGGSALDDATRGTMEQSLGDDFSDVRVHSGAEAAQLNRSLGARAFTTGSDVFFGADASPADKGLLAHELTHVTQQRAMSGSSGPLTVGAADDAHEHAAESIATQVAAGAAPAQRERED